MRILIDILHPAHVHLFKHVITDAQKQGHEVMVTSREKDVACELLDELGIPHECLSRIGNSKAGLFGEFLLRFFRQLKIVRRFKPDIMIGVMGAVIAPLGRLTNIPVLVLYGTENAKLTNRIVYACCGIWLTPQSFRLEFGKKHRRYNSFAELAYLAPDRFERDPSKLTPYQIDPTKPYTILRFVSWGASHDIGHAGLTVETKRQAVEIAQKYGKVYISSESELPPDLQPLQLKIAPSDLHQIVAHATLLYGESATLAAEAAALGTLAIYLDDCGRGFTDRLEEHGLVKNFTESAEDQLRSLDTMEGILTREDAKSYARQLQHELITNTDNLHEVIWDCIDSLAS